jgi:undecaprenyl-diphosphatase
VLEVPKMREPGGDDMTNLALLSGLVAGIVAFLSVWILMRYFKKRDFQALDPFAYYCWAVGILSLGALALGL